MPCIERVLNLNDNEICEKETCVFAQYTVYNDDKIFFLYNQWVHKWFTVDTKYGITHHFQSWEVNYGKDDNQIENSAAAGNFLE